MILGLRHPHLLSFLLHEAENGHTNQHQPPQLLRLIPDFKFQQAFILLLSKRRPYSRPRKIFVIFDYQSRF